MTGSQGVELTHPDVTLSESLERSLRRLEGVRVTVLRGPCPGFRSWRSLLGAGEGLCGGSEVFHVSSGL